MSRCMKPIQLKNENKNIVPCGKCPPCLNKRVSNWSFRLMQEEKVSISAYFLTLTYNTLCVPITNKGYMTIDKRDLQLYFKRLRKLNTNAVLKYYAVGEYGSKTKRPHYHIIIFNINNLDSVQLAWSKDGKPMGEVHIGTVSGASVGYTLKYVSKPKQIPMHNNDDRQREFSLMSKGIGKSYVNEHTIRYHNEKPYERLCVTTDQGIKLPMPRYYAKRLYGAYKQIVTTALQNSMDKELQDVIEGRIRLPTAHERTQRYNNAMLQQQRKTNQFVHNEII